MLCSVLWSWGSGGGDRGRAAGLLDSIVVAVLAENGEELHACCREHTSEAAMQGGLRALAHSHIVEFAQLTPLLRKAVTVLAAKEEIRYRKNRG